MEREHKLDIQEAAQLFNVVERAAKLLVCVGLLGHVVAHCPQVCLQLAPCYFDHRLGVLQFQPEELRALKFKIILKRRKFKSGGDTNILEIPVHGYPMRVLQLGQSRRIRRIALLHVGYLPIDLTPGSCHG